MKKKLDGKVRMRLEQGISLIWDIFIGDIPEIGGPILIFYGILAALIVGGLIFR